MTTAIQAPVRLPEAGLDWRYLTPRASLGPTVVAGAIEASTLHAISAQAVSLRQLGEPGPSYDTAILVAPSLATVRRALVDLNPEGILLLERVARRHRSKVRAMLGDIGFSVSTWWHRPSLSDTRCLVGLDQPKAAATVLRTVAGRGRRAPLEAELVMTRLVPRWGREVSLLAIAPGPDGRTPASAMASADGTSVAGLLTPRYLASRAVIGVTVTGDGGSLDQVVKIARAAADDPLIEREFDALDRFVAAGTDRGAVPSNHRLVRRDGRSLLIEDAASGVPLDRRRVRESPHAALAAGRRWLEAVPVGPPSRPIVDGRAEALLLGPLSTIEAMSPRIPGERADLVIRARRLLERLAEIELPSTFEHGDFSHPNLFRRSDGDLVVIDWEAACGHGLPLHDLTFYVAYLAESVDRPRGPEALIASHRRALGPEGWAADAIGTYCERLGVDERSRHLLALACWTRACARLSEIPDVMSRPMVHRHELLWRAAIEVAEEAG